MGLMGWQMVGGRGAHAPSWVRTIGEADFPRWETLQREKCAHQLACNVCIKIKNPSSRRARDQKLKGRGSLRDTSPNIIRPGGFNFPRAFTIDLHALNVPTAKLI